MLHSYHSRMIAKEEHHSSLDKGLRAFSVIGQMM